MPASRPAPRGRLLIALALFAAALPVAAVQLREVRVVGVDDELEANVRGRLSLSQHPATETLTEARLEYLVERAPEEARRALEPFGYYDAEVNVRPRRQGQSVRVEVRVAPGEPVRVRERRVVIAGPAADDAPLAGLVAGFEPEPGQVFDHRRYEASKSGIQRGLMSRGYFEARLTDARVEVTRASHSADIDLAWESGTRARFGAIRFVDSHVDPGILHSRSEIEPGSPFDQAELLKLHQQLLELDYFSVIDVQPMLAEATGDPPAVPVEIALQPAKRSVYRAGVSYGSDNGAGIRLGFDRRWLNRRGHKLSSDFELGQRRSTFATQYRIPAFARIPGWWSVGVLARRETGGAIETDLAGFQFARSFEFLDDQWSAEFHVQRERYEDQYTTLVYPALRHERKRMDEPLYPRRGYGLSTQLRAGDAAIGSQVDFQQFALQARWVRGLGERQRILLRGEIGRTFGESLERLPPSLRFYAGGDRSVRGYGYQELGPRDAEDNVIGGRNLLVGSVELEHMFSERWGAAVFVDAGNAFNGSDFDAAVGVGIGLRWRSPIGPVRLDLGHGLDDPRQGLRLHLTIGPQL
jgi:translocation and assembly module TamA